MNEEENQAFKILHFYNSEDYGTEELKKYIKIIVNLVEKQQKEIEELKRDYNKQIKETNTENKRCMFLAVENQDLKEKIKEYEELINEFEEYWSKDPRQL